MPASPLRSTRLPPATICWSSRLRRELPNSLGLPRRRPAVPPGLTHKRADCRRMRPAAYGGQIDRPHISRLDQLADDEVWIRHAAFREKPEAQARLDHRLHPVVARRTEHLSRRDSARGEILGHIFEHLTI